MSAAHGTNTLGIYATVDTPESASERRRQQRIRRNKLTRRDLRDVRAQLREARAFLGAARLRQAF